MRLPSLRRAGGLLSRWLNHKQRSPRQGLRRQLELEPLEHRLVLDGGLVLNPAVSWKVLGDWGSGFQGGLTLVNNQSTTISDWRLEFDFGRKIDSIWNAQVASQAGNHYVLKPAAYNGTINQNASVEIGFLGSPGNLTTPPTNFVLSWGAGTPPPPPPPPPALPTLSISDAAVQEGNSGTVNATLTITLSKAATSTVTVSYATQDGTAVAGQDYNSASGALSFAAGETQKTITIAVRGDATYEADETLQVRLSNPAGATLADGDGLLTIRNDDAAPPPPPTSSTYNYGEVLQKALFFYEANRSGDLPDNYRVNWRGDSAMNDGKDVGVDLTGGYYDAGDHVKFGLPMASSMTLLIWGLVQYRDAYVQSGQLARMEEAVRWGTDWLMKAHTAPNELWGQVGNGALDHAAWVAPEVMQMNRPAYKIDASHPGSDLAGEAAAALAAASVAFKTTDPVYAAKLLQNARELYNFADTYRGKYSDSIPDAANFYNSYSGYEDELVWGGVWMYKATGEQSYLDKAEAIYAQKFRGQTMTWTHSWDDKRYGAAVMLAQVTGKAEYKADVERWLDYWSVGINGGATRIQYTAGGLAWLNGWGSLRYAATTSFLALLYSDTVRDYSGRYHDFAKQQIEYMLGSNPNHQSYVVGFGQNSPQFPHHRGASGVWDGNVSNPTPNRHILYGALVGGPESPDDNSYHDVRSNYISNEVALDYNAGFTGAVARLFREYGGTPLANFPAPEAKGDEYFVEASINQSGTTFTEVRGLLNNRSAWPARISSNLAFRYFVDLSEVYAAGYSASDVEVKSNYSQGATLTPLLAWDESRNIYYVEVSFTGVPIGPGAGQFMKEAQVRLGLRSGLPATAWDPTNDWSYQGLKAGRDAVLMTDYIPVYEAGKLLDGLTPGAPGGPQLPRLSVANLAIAEGNTGSKFATFTVRLNAASSVPVTVGYSTQDGTARAGLDYTATSGSLTFAPGVTAMNVQVAILGDQLVEGDEAFKLVLSNPTNALLSNSQATGTIQDDDAPASGASVSYAVKDDWGTGFVAEMTIKNLGTTAVNGWTLEFDFDHDITNIWNGVIVSRVGKHYTIRNASWNAAIPAGGSVTFGFEGRWAAGKNGPSNMLLNGKPV